MKEFYQFPDKKSAENFTRLEVPIEGTDIGDGTHVPKELSMTVYSAPSFKHPKTETWLVDAKFIPLGKVDDKVEIANAELTEDLSQIKIPK